MTYSIQRLTEEGHFCLRDLNEVESLDVFWEEADKVERLYIEDTGVFVAPSINTRLEKEEFGFNCRCRRDKIYSTILIFVGKRDDIDSLRSVAFRVLCLPETGPHELIIEGNECYVEPGDTYDQLSFTSEQLRHIMCAYPSRSYSFLDLSFTAEQSVEIVSHRKSDIYLHECHFDDKGQAIVDWLDSRNGKETLDLFYFQRCNCFEMILRLLSRSIYPVFDKLDLYGDVSPHLTPLIAAANVKSVKLNVRFFLDNKGWRASILDALRDGTFRPPNLTIYSYILFDEDETPLVSEFLDRFLTAVSSPGCFLKELHLLHFDSRSIPHDLERYLLDMLRENRSLQVLGIYSDVAPLEFPQMNILNAATRHPRLRKLCFNPPNTYDPPELGQSEPFQVWLRENRSYEIQFNPFSESGMKAQLPKWQNAVFSLFTKDFDALQQVEDERIRSHLLVTALAICRRMPDRIYYLLSGNQDILAR